MFEVIATVYCTCLIISLVIVCWNYFATSKQLQSPRLSNINTNLAKINLYWSTTNETFMDLKEDSVARDARKSLRSCILIGILGFGSVIGLFLLIMTLFSLKVLIKNRKTLGLYASELATNPGLTPDQVTNIYTELSQIV